MKKTSANAIADLHADESLLVTRQLKKRYPVPAYHCLGGNVDYTTQIKGYDGLYDVLQYLSPPATWFWWALVKGRNSHTNVSIYRASSNLEAKKITKGFTELKEKKLVKRIKQKHYILNPLAIIPDFKEFNSVSSYWESLPTTPTTKGEKNARKENRHFKGE